MKMLFGTSTSRRRAAASNNDYAHIIDLMWLCCTISGYRHTHTCEHTYTCTFYCYRTLLTHTSAAKAFVILQLIPPHNRTVLHFQHTTRVYVFGCERVWFMNTPAPHVSSRPDGGGVGNPANRFVRTARARLFCIPWHSLYKRAHKLSDVCVCMMPAAQSTLFAPFDTQSAQVI